MRSGVVYANAQLRTLNPIIKDLGKMVPLAALGLPTMVTQADVSTANPKPKPNPNPNPNPNPYP